MFCAVVAIISLIGTVCLNYYQLKQIDIAGEKEQKRDHRDRQRDKIDEDRHVEMMKHVVETVMASRPDDVEMKKYAVAAKAFRLADEICSYLENNKILPGRFRAPFALGSIPVEQTAEVTYAQRYKAEYGQRLKDVVEELIANGVKLPQAPEQYYDPTVYSWVPLTIDQLKQSASLLVADLIRKTGLRVVDPQDSMSYFRGIGESVAAPTDSAHIEVTKRPKRPDGM